MLESFDTQTVITLLVGVVLPALVALVTKQVASSKLKNTALLALAALSSVLVPLIGAETYDWQAVVTSFLQIFGVSVLTYVGVYKPRGTTDAIQTKVPGGIG